MPAANSLHDLLRIRAANEQLIDRVNGNLGSALGFKKTTDGGMTNRPAVLIFVPRKIKNTWLPVSQQIPSTLSGPDGLTCPTDVVEGSAYQESYLKLYESDGSEVGSGADGVAPWTQMAGEAPLSNQNVELLEKLHGWSDAMPAGGRLAGFDSNGYGYTGTAGCFVRDRSSQALGILTNHHVADHANNILLFPWFNGQPAGQVVRLEEYARDDQRFPGVIDAPNAWYRVDCAFLEIPGGMHDLVDPLLPGIGEIGSPLALDLETMGPVGRRVTSVGSRRGVQSGKIVAFSYEFHDGQEAIYTDYLIIGDDDLDERGVQVTRTAFSDHGDSGKIILTDDDTHNVVALLWGGWQKRLRRGKMQEDWTYAIGINYVLDLLDVDVVSTLP
jgi:hypothetical protein